MKTKDFLLAIEELESVGIAREITIQALKEAFESTIKKKNPVYFAGCGYIFNEENIEIVFTDSNGETLRQEKL